MCVVRIMIIDYVKEAKSILDNFKEEVPIAVYDLADEKDISVLISQKSDVNKNSGSAEIIKGIFIVSSLLEDPEFKNKLGTIKGNQKCKSFSLFLYTANPLERRLIVAYYIGLVHLYFKQTITAQEVVNNAVLSSIDITSPFYTLALNILVPESKLVDILRDEGVNNYDAQNIPSVMNKLSELFLISKVDMERRLEKKAVGNEGC